MPYKFSFDLSQVPQSFFKKITNAAYEKHVHGKIDGIIKQLVEMLKIVEITGLSITDASMLAKDLVDTYLNNILDRDKFLRTKKRAIFLPHCSRKYMDGRCRASFDSKVPSYYCGRCSTDCLINKATTLAEDKGYAVYVVPGGSCIPQIMEKNSHEGIIGVACAQELKMGVDLLKSKKLPGQSVFLTKNGCANTKFNLRSLQNIL